MQTKQDPREPVLLMALKIILHAKLCLSVTIFIICGFQECQRSLKYNKSPGPDSIVNEVLKMIPFDMRKTIHMLPIVMWATKSHPKTRKWVTRCSSTKIKDQNGDKLVQASGTGQHLVQAMETHDNFRAV
jgi:hypothetical protein